MAAKIKIPNLTAGLLLVSALGCKLGLPGDRTVQVSRHFSEEHQHDEPPPTRLAPSSADRATNSSVAETPVAGRQGVTARLAAEKPATDEVAATRPSAKPAGPVDMRFSDETLDRSADRPADRVADTVSSTAEPVDDGHEVATTREPSDISEQLIAALESLPVLPEETAEPESSPIRIAATFPNGDRVVGSELSDKVVVRQSAGDGAMDEPTVAAVSATAPAAPPADVPTSPVTNAGLYRELIDRLQPPTAVESEGERFRRELVRRQLLVLAGDPDAALDGLQKLGKAEQRFLRHHLAAIWELTDPDGHPVTSRRFATALPKYRGATRSLSEATEELDVRELAFCTEIVSYGQVKRFPNSRFDAGQKVILYCEIDNFVAEPVDGGFETELQGSYEIYDAAGEKAAGQVLPADRMVCDHYLRDYFIAYQMHLPPQLEPGEYQLELTMECVKGNKYGQASVPLVIED